MTTREFRKTIGRNLKRNIDMSGLTYKELSKMAHIDINLMEYYIDGEAIPSLKNMCNICTILDIQINDIIPLDICGIIK